MRGKCPNCGNLVSQVSIDGVEGRLSMGQSFNMLTYNCPGCQTVLGVQMDPIAVKTDTVNALFERLRQGR
jgi:hypothetical protein